MKNDKTTTAYDFETQVNKRIIQIFDVLLETGQIKTRNKLACVLGTYSHIVTRFYQGTQNPSLQQLQILVNVFRVNAEFFMCRSDVMFQDDSKSDNDIVLQSKINLVIK